jgi:hypothetical protein
VLSELIEQVRAKMPRADELFPVQWSTCRKLVENFLDPSELPDLTGDSSSVLDAYRGSRHGRLVIVGAPGSGKTVLAHHLAHALLSATRGRPTDPQPVPLLVSASGWVPGGSSFADWVMRRIRDFSEECDGQLRESLILPIIDDLDGHFEFDRRVMIADLNAGPLNELPLVVVCRSEEYLGSETYADSLPLAHADVIELESLSLEAIYEYLRREFRTGSENREEERREWGLVISHMDGHPGCPVLEALSSPLVLNEAKRRFTYRGASNIFRWRECFASPMEAETWLMSDFAAHRLSNWDYSRVNRWLAAIAQGRQRVGSRSAFISNQDTRAAYISIAVLWLVVGAGLTAVIVAPTVLDGNVLVFAVVVVAVIAALVHFVPNDGGLRPDAWRLHPRVDLRRLRTSGVQGSLAFGVLAVGFGLPVAARPLAIHWEIGLTAVAWLIFFTAFWQVDGWVLRLIRSVTGLAVGTVVAYLARYAFSLVETLMNWNEYVILTLVYGTPLAVVLALGVVIENVRTGLSNDVLITPPLYALFGLGIGLFGAFAADVAAESPLPGLSVSTSRYVALLLYGMVLSLAAVTCTDWFMITLSRFGDSLRSEGTMPAPSFLDDAESQNVLHRTGGCYEFRYPSLEQRFAAGQDSSRFDW